MQGWRYTPATNITSDAMILTEDAVISAGGAKLIAPPVTFSAAAAVKVTGNLQDQIVDVRMRPA